MVCGMNLSFNFLLTRGLVLDPVFKLGYLKAAWEQEYLDLGMEKFKARVRPLHCRILSRLKI